MPSISDNMMSLWRNYHLTQQGRYQPRVLSDPDAAVILSQSAYPDGTVRNHATINCSDLVGETGPAMFAATAAVLQTYIATVLTPPDLPVTKRPAVDLVPIGRGWSFSALVGGIDTQIDLSGLSGFALAQPGQMAPSAAYAPRRTAFVLGGTRLRELLGWAQRRHGLSIKTSGTHLGFTIAGAIGTASHGSRLGFGGMQDLVTGLHLVTGPAQSVWIERQSKPVLNDATIASFTTQAPIRDDAIFADALVHLGGMGIVNGVTLDMVKDAGYELSIKRQAIDANWLDNVAAGRWTRIAAALGHAGKPVFYEMTIDPMNWHGNKAVHTLYLPGQSVAQDAGWQPSPRGLADLSGAILSAFGAAKRDNDAKGGADEALTSAFDMYCAELEKNPDYRDPPRNARWNQLHLDEITGGYPGALYNASYAVPRGDIAAIIPLLCEAVKGLLPTFVFTLRFVSNPGGTMAFTRFPETCVIEIDGFSRNAPYYGPALGDAIVQGAARLRACLDGQNALGRRFEHSMHWGKLGKLDKDKVWADFGAPGTPGSRIDRWRATREKLLDPGFAKVLWNQGLVDYGLLDQPPLPDALPPRARGHHAGAAPSARGG